MNVASKQLCEELFKLSDWYDVDLFYVKSFTKKDEYKNSLWDIESYSSYSEHMTKEEFSQSNTVPAYDLGYLLRKLPINTNLRKHADSYGIEVKVDRVGPAVGTGADTPEDAACKLAIELFKQDILTPTQKDKGER